MILFSFSPDIPTFWKYLRDFDDFVNISEYGLALEQLIISINTRVCISKIFDSTIASKSGISQSSRA
jgi:hypothetical protein